MAGRLNRAAWRGFDTVFKPWMRGRMHVCMAGVPRAIPAGSPVMLVSNHVSWWDGFLLRAIQKAIRPASPLYTVALERELVSHPILRLIGGIGLTPSSPASILHALRSLADKCVECPDSVVGYFPQGCISPSFRRPLGFTRGVELFIRRLGPVTVLPVSIHVEPLTGAAPTAFVQIGTPQASDTSDITSSSLERVVTQLLDASLASLALHGESAAAMWQDTRTLYPSTTHPRSHFRNSDTGAATYDA